MFSAVKLTNSKPRFQLWCMECVHIAGPRQPKQEYILLYEQWTKSPAGNRGYYHYSVALKECMDVPCVRHCQCPRVRLFCQNDLDLVGHALTKVNGDEVLRDWYCLTHLFPPEQRRTTHFTLDYSEVAFHQNSIRKVLYLFGPPTHVIWQLFNAPWPDDHIP